MKEWCKRRGEIDLTAMAVMQTKLKEGRECKRCDVDWFDSKAGMQSAEDMQAAEVVQTAEAMPAARALQQAEMVEAKVGGAGEAQQTQGLVQRRK